MLHVKKENEIPIDSKYYQNNVSNSNLEEPSNSQNEKHFIPHVVEINSNLNNKYQITTNRMNYSKKTLNNLNPIRKPEKQKIS